MSHLKILSIVARLMFASESDGLTCRVDSVMLPPWNGRGAVVDCIGRGVYRTFTVNPSGLVVLSTGRVS